MSYTPDQSRKSGMMITASPAPFLTPRPERRRMDSRCVEGNSNRADREEVNVQVILRCRPPAEDEKRVNVPKVILCDEQKRAVTVLQNLGHRQIERTFTFDKVFGPKAQQRSIYDQAIQPIVNEVLEGFNCTVFAYGQTGTGKTYTMEGGVRNKAGELAVDAGVIPRAVKQIVDTLDATKSDYSMKVSFLELYNEEITDLLAQEDSSRSVEDKQRKPISLMEDGKGGVVVRGLEEEVVYSANEIYNILERGSAKRRIADTMLNKRSSRSHSIFSVTIHVKEASTGTEELITCGKLNLVDLAGSENISRSLAREGRAKDAGEINKSVLTLGRVITALVEHSGHIPYRDSKLTRLLRDSLGGKTKTCIIATISSSASCLEETLSTLDYAYRARNIRNKPEANQKISKSALLKDLYQEIQRMKEDVQAAREKNGIYIPHERFVQDEAEKKAMVEKIEHLEFDFGTRKKEVSKLQKLYHAEQEKNLDLQSQIQELKIKMENANGALQEHQEKYKIADIALKEKELIISNLLHSEKSMFECAKELRSNLQTASVDMSSLSSKLDHNNKLERVNYGLLLTFGSELDKSLKSLHKVVVASVSQHHQHFRCMEEYVGSFNASKCEATKKLESQIDKIKDTYTSGIMTMKALADTLEKRASTDLEQLKLTVSAQTMAVENFLVTAVSEAGLALHAIESCLDEQKQVLALSAQQQEEGLKRCLASTHLISRATTDFVNNLQRRANMVSAVLDENHIRRGQKLASFESAFKEEAAEAEKLALEKFAEILTSLTAKKISLVSEIMRNMKNEQSEEDKIMHHEMHDMQEECTKAKNNLSSYIELVESQLQEETVAAVKTRGAMANNAEECSKKVSCVKQLTETAQISVENLHACSAKEIESAIETNILANKNLLDHFGSISSSTDAGFSTGIHGFQTTINDSLKLDHQAMRDIQSISNTCFDQLRAMQDSHSLCIKDLRKQADQCLRKDYLVDNQTTPKSRTIAVPSLASIEELRAPSFDDMLSKMTLVNVLEGNAEAKQCHIQADPGFMRSPLTDLN